MDYKSISLQEPLFSRIEQIQKANKDPYGGHPEFDSVPKLAAYFLNQAVNNFVQEGNKIE